MLDQLSIEAQRRQMTSPFPRTDSITKEQFEAIRGPITNGPASGSPTVTTDSGEPPERRFVPHRQGLNGPHEADGEVSRYCAGPGCTNPLRRDQKTYCSRACHHAATTQAAASRTGTSNGSPTAGPTPLEPQSDTGPLVDVLRALARPEVVSAFADARVAVDRVTGSVTGTLAGLPFTLTVGA